MRHLLTLLLLASSSLCLGQFARDTEPEAPLLVSTLAAQSYFAQLAPDRQEATVYISDSKTAKACHKDQNCRGLHKCTHAIEKLTRKPAEQEYGPVKCRLSY